MATAGGRCMRASGVRLKAVRAGSARWVRGATDGGCALLTSVYEQISLPMAYGRVGLIHERTCVMRLRHRPLPQVIRGLRKAVPAAFVLFIAAGVWFMYRDTVWIGYPWYLAWMPGVCVACGACLGLDYGLRGPTVQIRRKGLELAAIAGALLAASCAFPVLVGA